MHCYKWASLVETPVCPLQKHAARGFNALGVGPAVGFGHQRGNHAANVVRLAGAASAWSR